ncbi:NAD(P)/FAD-dependent oxidoreductase [Streptomyces albidoflavus]
MPTPHAHPQDHAYDVIVIGGGAAGLAGAVTLGRARRTVLVVDAGTPRNAPAAGVHTFLSREGISPAELLRTGRAEVTSYGGEIREGTVTDARREDGRFRVTLADGSEVSARRLLVTTGITDELPPVQGLAALWGKDVLHCPYCHGWEAQDLPTGVLATGPLSVHQALLWRQWTDDLTLFTHTTAGPTPEEREQLEARGTRIVDGEVTGVETDEEGRLAGVRLADGSLVPVRALATGGTLTARAGFLAGLGLETVPVEVGGTVVGSRLDADPTGLTSVPGVWAAGNVVSPTDQVVISAGAAVRAAAVLNMDLVTEETRLAVEARRAG